MNYQEIKKLEHRIMQFQMLRAYMETFLNCKPFSVEIKTTVLGWNIIKPLGSINTKHESNSLFLHEESDAKEILDFMDKKLIVMKEQFETETNKK